VYVVFFWHATNGLAAWRHPKVRPRVESWAAGRARRCRPGGPGARRGSADGRGQHHAGGQAHRLRRPV